MLMTLKTGAKFKFENEMFEVIKGGIKLDFEKISENDINNLRFGGIIGKIGMVAGDVDESVNRVKARIAELPRARVAHNLNVVFPDFVEEMIENKKMLDQSSLYVVGFQNHRDNEYQYFIRKNRRGAHKIIVNGDKVLRYLNSTPKSFMVDINLLSKNEASAVRKEIQEVITRGIFDGQEC